MAFNWFKKENEEAENKTAETKHYLSGKEVREIAKANQKEMRRLEKEKNRLIEITVDGQITEDEMKDFEKIQEQLFQISMAIDSLQLWVQKAIADGRIDKKD